MVRALWTSATGMEAQQLRMDVISNNLANINTTGFKRSRPDFQDLLYQNLRTAGSSSTSNLQFPTGIQVGLGTKNVAIQKNFSQGDFAQTGNPLDLVIEGDGFFQVLQPNGIIGYTRAGTFKVDSTGNVVTSNGFLIEPSISIPQGTVSITVGSDGTVSVEDSSQTNTQVGNISLSTFLNPAGLKSVGKNLYLQTPASGTPILGVPGENGVGTVSQGFLEMSNVEAVEEMISMIVAQRAYETNAKSIQTVDTMLQTTNNIKR